MNDRTISTLRRRLEKWELEHLRKLAAELHERIEIAEEAKRRAEDEASRAWESAEFWRENAFELQEELMNDGYTIGLTKEGQMVAIKSDLPTDAERQSDSIEQLNGSAHENHAVTIAASGQNHLDTSADRIGRFDIDPVNVTGDPGGVEVGAEQTDAVIPGVGNRAGIEVADDHGHAEVLATSANSQDGQLNAIDGRQQGATDLHESPSKVTWPGDGATTAPIDWSPLAGRPVIFHPDNRQDKP